APENVIVLAVNWSFPFAEKNPEKVAALAVVKLPTAKTVSAARRFSIGGSPGKKVPQRARIRFAL
ncbi:MAG TPA: hypothetical protein VJU82_03795, partial [Acidobacteriaceae bacterium]|nr:hypothetical protein [Acidobacteriaceae bacterium]